MINKFAAVI